MTYFFKPEWNEEDLCCIILNYTTDLILRAKLLKKYFLLKKKKVWKESLKKNPSFLKLSSTSLFFFRMEYLKSGITLDVKPLTRINMSQDTKNTFGAVYYSVSQRFRLILGKGNTMIIFDSLLSHFWSKWRKLFWVLKSKEQIKLSLS